MPLSEYSFCNFNNIFETSVFFEILLSIVPISKGSAAAKIIASISFSTEDNLEGKLITLSFFFIFFLSFIFFYINIIKKFFLFNS